MKSSISKKLTSTALAATLGTFFVLSSFGSANAHWRSYRHHHRSAGIAAGFFAGVAAGVPITAGSRASRHRHRHCHRDKRGRIYKCHRHSHVRRHHR